MTATLSYTLLLALILIVKKLIDTPKQNFRTYP
jgi:hypothetical protein